MPVTYTVKNKSFTLEHDEFPKSNMTLELLSQFKPAFLKVSFGTRKKKFFSFLSLNNNLNLKKKFFFR